MIILRATKRLKMLPRSSINSVLLRPAYLVVELLEPGTTLWVHRRDPVDLSS